MEQDWNHFWTGAFLVIAVFGAGCWALLREGTYTRRREVLGWWIVALMSCLLVASLAYGWAAGAAGQGDTAEALWSTAIGLTVILLSLIHISEPTRPY